MSEQIFCAKCRNPTEETLLLSCDHNLCISCSAENLTRLETRGMNKTQIVICDLCKSQTFIDNETSKEILSIALSNQHQYEPQPQSNPNANSISYNNNVSFSKNEDLNTSNLSRLNQLPVSQPSYQKREICQEHGEEITYLCFDCLSKCICSECVVHGVHKNHEVINTRKAYPIICEKTNDLMQHVGEKVKELSAADRTLEAKKNEILSLSDKCKRDIQLAFEEMRNKLNRKEKEILEKTDLSVQDNLQELNTYSRILQSKIISLNKTIDSLQSRLMRKDELGLINFYCENKNKILTNAEITEMDNMPDLDTIAQLNVNIDKSSFDTMVNALNAIHFEITAMKGMGLTQQESSHKYSVRRNLYGTNAIQSTFNSSTASNVPVTSGGSPMLRKPNINSMSSSTTSQFNYSNLPQYKQQVSITHLITSL